MTPCSAAQGTILEGGDGNDVLNGGAGNNIVRSGYGDDTVLVSGAANEAIFGGNGTDLVRFISVSRSQMTVTRYADRLEVSGGGLGTRTLYGVELLQFNDMSAYCV